MPFLVPPSVRAKKYKKPRKKTDRLRGKAIFLAIFLFTPLDFIRPMVYNYM